METPGTYTATAVPVLLKLVPQTSENAPGGATHVTIGLVSNTSATQLTNLTVTAPAGLSVTMDPTSVNLAGNASQAIMLEVAAVTQPTQLTVVATSNLGGFAVLGVTVVPHGGNTTTSQTSTSDTSTSGTDTTKASPLAAVPFVALAVVGLAAFRRRLA
jgi:hypothetical protein